MNFYLTLSSLYSLLDLISSLMLFHPVKYYLNASWLRKYTLFDDLSFFTTVLCLAIIVALGEALKNLG